MLTQAYFDTEFVTSAELAKVMNVSRVAVFLAIQHGRLPAAFHLGQTVFWEVDTIAPAIINWQLSHLL